MTIRNNYEASSEGAVRHWEVPQARLENNAPTPTQPAALTSRTAGTQLTGTILGVDNDDDIALIDFTPSMVYRHFVRNVLTYSGAAENIFGAINAGDAVYYDGSGTMPADVFLSTSPLDASGNANPLFGFVVPADEDDTFPKGTTSASTQTCAVMQRGAGA